MVSKADEPECPHRQAVILPGIVGAVRGANATAAMPADALASADDAPRQEATKPLAHATIHPAVTGAATAGRELLVTATQTSVGASAAADLVNSIAVH